MSCFPLKTRLLPSKKAWRSFTSRLQPKLRKLRRSKTIKHRKRVHTKKLHHCQSFAPVYVDELFQPRHEPTVVKEGEAGEKMGRFVATSSPSTSSSSPLPTETSCSVDTRAEMFIAKFKEDMRLQRQKSLEKYQEMLARGV
ncbi:uncharacterized protein M6B38_361590 [Iris pallida]|uniref:Uncharacterized protein n=1 Tax=Iris pallida TaxID=29817 RepID=A0AAX6GKN6_IRIPA|nr:uncharacterized protein M6B38_361590 [Iris pallida]